MLATALAAAVALAVPASAGDAPAATIRVLTHNIYGRNEAGCEQRYRALAKHILAAHPPYDVVALQEHWRVPFANPVSCDADVLTKALEADGRYKGAGHSVRHKPAADEFGQVAGGDSVFTLHRIADQQDGRWVNGKNIPLSGYLLTRVELKPGVTLDLWDVHLEAAADGCDDDCRWEQATDLGSAVELFSGAVEKGRPGNPVLIVGDFNTGGPLTQQDKPPFPGNGGYANVMDALENPRDLWLELGRAPGYTIDCMLNAIEKCGDRERIDYVLLPEHKRVLDPSSEFVLVPKTVEVVRWFTDDGKPISDHFGLDATLEVRQRPTAAQAKAFLERGSERLQRVLAEPTRFDSAR